MSLHRVNKPHRWETTANIPNSAGAEAQQSKRKRRPKKKAKKKAEAQALHNEQMLAAQREEIRPRRIKSPKIMLPGPKPTDEYLNAAAQDFYVVDPPRRMLVILDLNGALVHRPDNNPRKTVPRPFLAPFLDFLFDNFCVMVWSSARPQNVARMVDSVLPPKHRSGLVARWDRSHFKLTPEHYAQNVQVYKDLNLVWTAESIQPQPSDADDVVRWDQSNTILVDDTALKAQGQPYNLVEIPEFTNTPAQQGCDILREVASYLQTARMQVDVSRFIKNYPFKADGTWKFDWPDDLANVPVAGMEPLHPTPRYE
ncbi:HAD-like protein [Aaosphaeria arxii CBS 175.79]|uniref:Mitochondrial import inner membrane translocase subunit TIM50 n=1 Tax=Aaosphaeria arxii CBS 175.79 TaxID=1450172 RepID=A0A6A5XU21_9PLEO|nr:HAD-like protein [Aaosphaeria arxii CBS 175.79]KAF2016692.1 HAD-like protein [Aaosphaeria arxii CBS 175.79]